MHDHLDEAQESPLFRASRSEPAAFGRSPQSATDNTRGPGQLLDLQRSAGNASVADLVEERSPVHDVINSGGRPLEPHVRTDMEVRLGADFSDVRIHDDSAAAASASAVNAHAYTVGSNVVFQRDTYDPSSHSGQVTLAHELTHVIQQRSGPVEGTSAPGGIQVSDPSDRFEREAGENAHRAMAEAAPGPRSTTGVPIQREENNEEELQGLFVQREAGTETPGGVVVQREPEDEDLGDE